MKNLYYLDKEDLFKKVKSAYDESDLTFNHIKNILEKNLTIAEAEVIEDVYADLFPEKYETFENLEYAIISLNDKIKLDIIKKLLNKPMSFFYELEKNI